MRFESQTFWLSKDADAPEQYQDAFELDSERGVAAIADGVSSAIFSGPWARILTRAVVAETPDMEDTAAFVEWLARQREAWKAEIDTSKLTWYQRPKMAAGAMTTLLWVELWPEQTGDDGLAKTYVLRYYAIGDSCLFHVRDGRTLYTAPINHSSEFGLDPSVVGSIDRKLDHLLAFSSANVECLPGDLLVLCTDAIALWAMHRAENGDPLDWESYWNMPYDEWRDEIFAARAETKMRFDDSTLVLLRVIEEIPAPPVEIEEGVGPAAVDARLDETVRLAETGPLLSVLTLSGSEAVEACEAVGLDASEDGVACDLLVARTETADETLAEEEASLPVDPGGAGIPPAEERGLCAANEAPDEPEPAAETVAPQDDEPSLMSDGGPIDQLPIADDQ